MRLRPVGEGGDSSTERGRSCGVGQRQLLTQHHVHPRETKVWGLGCILSCSRGREGVLWEGWKLPAISRMIHKICRKPHVKSSIPDISERNTGR